MKELTTYMLLVLGGNATPSADDVRVALYAVGIQADDERLNKLIAGLEGKDLNEVLESGKEMLATFGSGGGGGG
jgi:large subunit ribosomal protein LP2